MRLHTVILLLVVVAAPAIGYEPPTGLADGWYARIDTDRGRIVARLHPEQSPQAVAHFAALAEGEMEWFDYISGKTFKDRYYDGTPVYLAAAAQRFEAGDRTGTGSGAPRMWIPPEEGRGPVNFSKAGRLGMTRETASRISGVQFFVTAAPIPKLNGFHPCFGSVVEGLEVVFEISSVKTHGNGRPIEPPMIEAIRIFSVGEPDPLPEPAPYYPSRHVPAPRRSSPR